jgi:TetR/AcrR family transcriptional repressor of lmrAB and yxaGH operons
MPSESRDRMVAGAVHLLAERGLQATSFSEVLAATGAPRGSIYHHFPDGKDQLVAEAVDLAAGHAVGLLDSVAGRPADEVAAFFLGMWREVLVRSDLGAGCAVLAVTVATDSPQLLTRVSTAFRSWRERLASLLREGGLGRRDAARFAATLIAASEGAVVLARAEQDLEPFDLVAEQLMSQVRLLLRRP